MRKVKGQHRLDKYYRLAKERGFRSRASYKLLQIDEKHKLLASSKAVLDLCAAPGSWMQVAVQKAPVGSLVLGIDLAKIAPVRGCVAIQQDITRTDQCRSKIKQVMEKHNVSAFDLVLHDGSPNVGGAWDQEAMSQNALVIDSLKLATAFLAPNGNFITKVFRSRDYESVRYCLEAVLFTSYYYFLLFFFFLVLLVVTCLVQLFDEVKVFKPMASRSESAETYLSGLRYKAPAKIPSHLLDYRQLFKYTAESKRMVVDVLRGSKQKRNRDGYEDGESVLRKVATAADFIWSEKPIEILGTVTCISFDNQASLPLKEHVLTTEEIKILCEDVPVLGKNEFKHILKWRMQIRKALTPEKKQGTKEADVAKEQEEDEEEEDDDKLLNELEELTNTVVRRKKKRAKKLLAKRIANVTDPQIDALEDGYVDHELFSLSTIKGKKDLIAVENEQDDNDNAYESDKEEASDGSKGSGIDSDEERQRYTEQMEETFDEAYERYMVKKEGSAKQRKRARQDHAEKLEGGDGEEEMSFDYDSDKDEPNPLVVALVGGEEAQTKEEVSNHWFSQNIFVEAVEEGDLGTEKHSQPLSKKPHQKSLKQKEEDDLEIVSTPETDSNSSSDDEVNINKAEILACAKRMQRKKQREEMLDDAYNKYMFDDQCLPNWFLDEEKKHRRAVKPITKEEVNAMKAQFREINARPAKKVAEAKARKKRAIEKRLEKVRKKANTISDTTDISNRSKDKMIDKLYKKAVETRKPKKELVVSKKGVGVKIGKDQKRVDRRMKSDARKRGGGRPGRNGKKSGQAW
ncbi:unnamed protein product [Eruca vesicaria subsp. sativa]|uniref:rRNA methyltransferase n=1 Tax=Eruca vesicaria subsp. sativa TaxID=29727 RepID=A0ABC8IUE2_ERUVS|nr:unnamed protein product [Eruca vesicaria subsp. sativa]